MKTWFRAYDAHSHLKLETWTSSPGTEEAERFTYQMRLNKGDFAKVEVSKPHEPHETMYPKVTA